MDRLSSNNLFGQVFLNQTIKNTGKRQVCTRDKYNRYGKEIY